MGAITIGHVITAAAEVTGVDASRLVVVTQLEPLGTYRRCAQVAALQVGVPQCQVWRAFGLCFPASASRRGRRDTVAGQHGDTIAAIADRARELAADNAAAALPTPARAPSAFAVLVATARVTRSSVRDILSTARAQPWTDYRCLAVVAARHVGVPRSEMAAALGRRPHTLSNRPGWHTAMVETHGATIAAIADMAATLSQTYSLEALRQMLRGPAVAVPQLDKYGRFPAAVAVAS